LKLATLRFIDSQGSLGFAVGAEAQPTSNKLAAKAIWLSWRFTS